MVSAFSAPHFHDEAAAYARVEARLWPQGPVCPHCGCSGRIGKLSGNSTRIGVHKCYDCRKPFTVKIGTIFEASHIPLHVWLQAIGLIAASKKGISSNQLHRMLGVTLKTAWFMSHRIREAMSSGDLDMFGGDGGIVEADETFIGREPGRKLKQGTGHKMKVLSMIERNTGRSRSVVLDSLKAHDLVPAILGNIDLRARLMTDEAIHYGVLGRRFADHQTVQHRAKEFVRGELHTNTVEGFFSVFKRGMKGIYQHCGKKHLHRYLHEFDFRHSNRVALGIKDGERADLMLRSVVGKRLTYKAMLAGI